MSAPFPPLQPYQIALMLAERIPEPTRTPAIAFVCGPGHLRADLMIDEVAHWPTPVITPEMVKVGKDFVLMRQVRTAAVDQINARQVISLGNFLRAQMLFDGHWVISAAFYGRVVAHDHAVHTADAANARDQACARRVVVVHVERSEWGHL